MTAPTTTVRLMDLKTFEGIFFLVVLLVVRCVQFFFFFLQVLHVVPADLRNHRLAVPEHLQLCCRTTVRLNRFVSEMWQRKSIYFLFVQDDSEAQREAAREKYRREEEAAAKREHDRAAAHGTNHRARILSTSV